MLYLLILYSFLVVRKMAFQCFKNGVLFLQNALLFLPHSQTIVPKQKKPAAASHSRQTFLCFYKFAIKKNEVGELQKAIRLPPIKFCFLWFA